VLVKKKVSLSWDLGGEGGGGGALSLLNLVPVQPCDCLKMNSVTALGESRILSPAQHGGVRGVRWGRNPGCYVTRFAPHNALKMIA